MYRKLEETFKNIQSKKNQQEAQYLFERTNNLKKEINHYISSHEGINSYWLYG